MRYLSDNALTRLRSEQLPDLGGTRYRLIAQVGRGGMGVVYAAEDECLRRRVALKVLEVPDPGGDLSDRLMREARVLGRLEHPGIVPVHDAGMLADGRVYYAMKFVEGQPLDQYIESQSTPDRLRIFLRICEAVAFAHAQGVLHRDLKPANVMVGPFGEVLVMDWGLAKIISGTGSPDDAAEQIPIAQSPGGGIPASVTAAGTGHGSVLGTPGYMSPEQVRGEIELLDARSDIYSLGALLRFLLSEKLPEQVTTLLDRSLEAICSKACAPAREARYSTVQEMSADVSRYLNGMPVGAHRESIFEKVTRLYRRYRFFVLLIGAYLVMRILLILLLKH